MHANPQSGLLQARTGKTVVVSGLSTERASVSASAVPCSNKTSQGQGNGKRTTDEKGLTVKVEGSQGTRRKEGTTKGSLT